MNKIRLGIIGIGNMGSAHCKNILDGLTPEIRLVAVADRKPSRRDWAGQNLPEVKIYTDGMELIRGGEVDAILIAVPHDQHPELAIAGFERGLHVMCEKPAGVYTLQVRDMMAAADRSGRTFGMMFNQRTNCVYRKVHDMVRSGELGELRRVNWIVTDWFRTQFYYDSGDWRASWLGEGGGVLLNQCPHNLDLLQWICGLPVSVRAFMGEGKWHDIEVEDDVTAYMEYENGATGMFVTTTGDAPGTNRLEITGTKGKLVCEDDKLAHYRLAEPMDVFLKQSREGFAKPGCERIEVELDGSNPQHVGVLNAFAGNILRGEPLIADGREGIRGLMLSNAMHLSYWLGETVPIPFDEQRFLGELNKRRATSRLREGMDVTLDSEGSY